MGDVIYSIIKKNIVLLGLVITALVFFVALLVWQRENDYYDQAGIRIEINQLIYRLEQSTEEELHEISFGLPYCVFDNAGVVQLSTLSKYKEGEKVDLHILGGRKSYIVPISIAGTNIELLYVDCSNYKSSNMRIGAVLLLVLAGILWFISILLLIRVQFTLKKDIFEPVKEIHRSTKNILAGDLQMPVKYDYDGEIGSCCHDFERMREALSDSYERESRLKEKIHVMYAGISHDLKTPLATMTGYLEEIIYGIVREPEAIRECAIRMLDKANILNRMIEDIMKHSKAELNQLTIKKQEVYAREYFEGILANYAEDAQQGGYVFTYELPDNILISLDPDRISEVMQNFIGNSVKYGKKGVRIQVSFEQVKQAGEMLVVSVHDNGCGIDAMDLPFIFNIFYRGNKARTQDIPGSGLGLNISKYIVEKHGGQIECDSIASVGTTISFSIPICLLE